MAECGRKNLIGKKLIHLRKMNNMSQRRLAEILQISGMDMDKNVITRIETGKRSVTDIELKAVAAVFDVSYDYLLDEKDDMQ